LAEYVIERDYTAGVRPLAGRYAVSAFGPALLAVLLEGRTFIEADATTAPDRPFPVALLIPGSGKHDRDETVADHRIFLVLADHLTRNGVAVLRCDDRGVGGSTGDKMAVTDQDLAYDPLAAVAFLKGHPEIDPKKIGLIGHSEGGIIAPIAAAKSDDVAYIILLAGPGLNGEELLYRQGELIARAMKADDKAVAAQRARQEKIFAILKKEKDDKRAPSEYGKIDETFAPAALEQITGWILKRFDAR
jgi:hypothetical protein